jgi:hypothetical protein
LAHTKVKRRRSEEDGNPNGTEELSIMAEVDVVALGAEATGEDTNQTGADATEAIPHGKLGGLKGATLLQKETNLR